MIRAARKYDLLSFTAAKRMLQSRWPQFVITAIALGGFILAILAGFVGTPVGSRNFSIIFVWIAWWALLMLVAVPVFGRGWCSICPIPVTGEWLQRGALLDPLEKDGISLQRRWPNRFRNIWLQNGAFALVALFSSVVLTHPQVTSAVLASFLFVAIGASLIFERRAFCRYLCPVGGFIGLYSQLAPVEVRVKDTSVCAAHTQKTCYTGSSDGYGCPWQVYPGALIKNTYCGTCLECLRTCPHDNVAINLRPFGSDLLVKSGRKLDEAFKAFIMLGAALVYSGVLLGPWGVLKSSAYSIGSAAWLIYAAGFILFLFCVLPGIFYVSIWLGRIISGTSTSLRKLFISQAYALVPLGLAAWIAFSLSFVFANLSYLWPVLSDPLGLSWNLIGTAGVSWQPYLTQYVPGLQGLILIAGLVWACLTTQRISAEEASPRAATLLSIPVCMFSLVMTLGLLGLLIG